MTLIPIKKEVRTLNGKEVDIFVVPAIVFNQNDGKLRKVPHPDGTEYIVFDDEQKAFDAVKRAGFDYSMFDKKQKEQPKYEKTESLNAIDALINLLSDKTPEVVASAIYSLGEIADESSIHHIISVFDRDEVNIRKNAIQALAKIGNACLPDVLRALKSENWVVRNSSALCLAEMNNNKNVNLNIALQPLIFALKDKNAIVRASAAIALGKVYKNIYNSGNIKSFM